MAEKLWWYKGKQVTCAFLAEEAVCTRYTMRYRLKKYPPEKAVEMGVANKGSEGTARIRDCPCGCGGGIFSNRQKWSDAGKCKLRWVRKSIKDGTLKPTSYGTCKREGCDTEFPRYKELSSTMTKEYCGFKCSRIDMEKVIDRSGIAITAHASRKVTKKNKNSCIRSEVCIKEGVQCKHYGNWLEYPNFNCTCVGEYVTPDKINENTVYTSAINYSSPNARIASSPKRHCE